MFDDPRFTGKIMELLHWMLSTPMPELELILELKLELILRLELKLEPSELDLNHLTSIVIRYIPCDHHLKSHTSECKDA